MAKPLRVLNVEDSESDTALLAIALKRGGYDPTLERVATAAAMNDALDRQAWDVIICDYAMPQFSTQAALALMKEKGIDLPFIILSGTIGEDNAVAAMKAGAHDYIMKDKTKRLIPAIERELREATIRRDQKIALAALKESEARLSGILNMSPNAVISIDKTQRIILFNHGAEVIFGYSSTEMMGKPLDRLLPPHLAKGHAQHIRDFAGSEEQGKSMESRPREISGVRKDGTTFPAEASIYKIDLNGETIFTAILRDITERKTAEKAIQHMAYYDSLTGLPNRAHLIERLEQEILINKGRKDPVALVLIDLDHFKEVNDTLGHDLGDSLIQQVGLRLKNMVRPTDTAARLGGDEFGLILPLARTGDAAIITDKVVKELEKPFKIKRLPLHVEASLGIAVFPQHGKTAEKLLQHADIAMYAAKYSGGVCKVYDPEQDKHSTHRLILMGELDYAIHHNQLVLRYQPKIDLKTGAVTGVEALVRWQHPKQGMVPPDQFILPAEKTGLIKPLTQWVLNAALSQSHDWRLKKQLIHVAVNLSVRNLQEKTLPARIADLLQAYDLAPSSLVLEVTESTIMSDLERATEILDTLCGMGISVSIDDFGTGHSSLAYIKKLPVNTIKIDKSFVGNMLANQDDAVIVRSTINLGHNLGLKVIAEGVEDQATLKRLAKMGCDEAQGYHIARPLSPEELQIWVKETAPLKGWKIQ